MRIAVDAMGGDYGPQIVVPGAVDGARAEHVDLALVGDEGQIRAELARLDTSGLDIEVVPASEQIGMDEHPAQAVRRKPDASINVALRLIKDGRANAMASAGNSGAVMAAALMTLGRIRGIERPAIASYLPTIRSRTLVLDLGAVTDPKPSNLVQFAIMGKVYAEKVLNRPNPTIGLLSNGEEPTKGNQLVQATYPLLAGTPGLNFQGNVEGRDVPQGTVDIVITDGFTGNVVLKTAEGVGAMIVELLRRELTATLPRKLAALALRPAFRAVRRQFDYAEIGGAPLLGVNGAVIISHGRSNETAIKNAVGVGKRAVEQDLAEAIREAIASTTTSPPVEAHHA